MSIVDQPQLLFPFGMLNGSRNNSLIFVYDCKK